MSFETWKPVVGFEGAYEVSDLGQVRSVDRSWRQKSKSGSDYLHKKKGKLLRPGIGGNGYPTVVLGRKAGSKTVHSLVAASFLGPCPIGQEVRHRNGDRADPRLSNLEYGTRSQNIKDAVAHGTWFSEARREHLSKLVLYRWGYL